VMPEVVRGDAMGERLSGQTYNPQPGTLRPLPGILAPL
jgi:hypothetical protein